MANFDIVGLRERVAYAMVPAVQLAVTGSTKVSYLADQTLFTEGAVEPGVVEALVIPEGFQTQKTNRGVVASVDFGVALRCDDEVTAWRAASGLYSLGKRSGFRTVNVSFIAPDEAEDPEFIVDARLSVDT